VTSSTAAATFLIAEGVFPTIARGACISPHPDASLLALSDGWCVKATANPNQQIEGQWTTAVGLQTLSLETLPGQLGAMALVDDKRHRALARQGGR
jgi:hypothetical protein